MAAIPKITLVQYTEKDINFSRAIKSCVTRTGTDLNKLVNRAKICRTTYFNHMRDPEQITVGELRVYIQMLKIPKEDVLAALYLDGGDQ